VPVRKTLHHCRTFSSASRAFFFCSPVPRAAVVGGSVCASMDCNASVSTCRSHRHNPVPSASAPMTGSMGHHSLHSIAPAGASGDAPRVVLQSRTLAIRMAASSWIFRSGGLTMQAMSRTGSIPARSAAARDAWKIASVGGSVSWSSLRACVHVA
jgi:hypothetical protein